MHKYKIHFIDGETKEHKSYSNNIEEVTGAIYQVYGKEDVQSVTRVAE